MIPHALPEARACAEFFRAVRRGDDERMSQIFAAYPERALKWTTADGKTAARVAIDFNQTGAMETLIDRCGLPVDAMIADLATDSHIPLLHYAASGGKKDMVFCLLQRGANPALAGSFLTGGKTYYKGTAFDMARQAGQQEHIKPLLQDAADIRQFYLGKAPRQHRLSAAFASADAMAAYRGFKRQREAFFAAIAAGDIPALQKTLDENPNAARVWVSGHRSALAAAVDGDRLDVFTFLLDNGHADADHVEPGYIDRKKPIIFYTVMQDKFEFMRALIDRKARVSCFKAYSDKIFGKPEMLALYRKTVKDRKAALATRKFPGG